MLLTSRLSRWCACSIRCGAGLKPGYLATLHGLLLNHRCDVLKRGLQLSGVQRRTKLLRERSTALTLIIGVIQERDLSLRWGFVDAVFVAVEAHVHRQDSARGSPTVLTCFSGSRPPANSTWSRRRHPRLRLHTSIGRLS